MREFLIFHIYYTGRERIVYFMIDNDLNIL